MCDNNLPRAELDSGAAGIRARDLLIASPSPYRYATEPHMYEGRIKILPLLRPRLIGGCGRVIILKKLSPPSTGYRAILGSSKSNGMLSVYWALKRTLRSPPLGLGSQNSIKPARRYATAVFAVERYPYVRHTPVLCLNG